MKRVQWREDSLVNLKVRDGLYTIGLMKRSPYMWIFDIHNGTGVWENLELNAIEPLFCVIIAQVVIQRLVDGKINKKAVVPPTTLEIPPNWIMPHLNNTPWKNRRFAWSGGKLVHLIQGPDMLDSPVIKPDLDVIEDRKLIESCELTNMWGEKDLSDRLARYFDTGVNRDDLKFEIFPDLWNDREKLRPLTRRLPVPFR
jgi:hypothetical protein